MNGKPAGGGMFRKRSAYEEREIQLHDNYEALKRSLEPHAVCAEHGPKIFRSNQWCDVGGLDCKASWTPVDCPKRNTYQCRHST